MLTQSLKKDIRKYSLPELQNWFTEVGEPKFRAKQLYEWLWAKSAHNFEDMSNLSLSLRTKLAENFVINPITISDKQVSNDRTIKSGFRLFDNHIVEGVLIPTSERMTACVSSQVGCSLSCKFCATGYMERKRNLDAAEIYDQVVAIKKQAESHYKIPLSNIVYMGMGEPLLNYTNVVESIKLITSPTGLGMSPKRITVSTAGIAKMIKKLADEDLGVHLALSLHAANDEKRDSIMPINETNTLEALKEALIYWYEKTGIRVTLEYILLYGVNDSLTDAQELLEFWKEVKSKINIIEFNPIKEAEFEKADIKTLEKFTNFLESKGVIVNVRRSRGKDIDAACGQLAIKKE
jgi:23S rRNA (adenine2503-C2)-methyltransferase